VHDEAMLDGNSRLNLATFVGTWMDPHADRLYSETADKNMVDKDEYPQTAAIETRCWKMIANLWNAPDADGAIGTSTIGSSEACMLGGLALKRRWQQARRAAGLSTEKPNLVLSSAVQVCWEKFCNYWDVEARYVPITDEHRCLDGFELEKYVDENTIGVVAIMGVTYTGVYEPVAEIAESLDRIQADTGLEIPIHVDGASGGMIAPFLQPALEWDFRVPRVVSISTSAHKYGLVYPGLGWVVWRTVSDLPADLVFDVTYLGGHMPSFALNFSRPGAQVLLQYYLFLRLGWDGYYKVQKASQDVAGVPRRRDRPDAGLRPLERRHRHPRLRVAADEGLHGQVEPLPSLRAAAAEGLADPRLPDARQPDRCRRTAHRGAQRTQSQPRRESRGRHPGGSGAPGRPAVPDADRGSGGVLHALTCQGLTIGRVPVSAATLRR
jgi:glutamate decarboxylase